MAGEISVETLAPSSLLIERVLVLHRTEKQRLGMMPRGAFEEYAAKGQLLIANDESGVCVGYLLYRIGKERAVIVHLCTDLAFRRAGIAKKLIERVKKVTKHTQGIALHCRRDYGVDGFWQQFGFKPVSSKAGRGSDQAELTLWWYSHGHPTLFSLAAEPSADERFTAVIDANVLFDLFDNDDPAREDSRALREEWVADSVELCLTSEIFSEINRADEPERRKRSRENISKLRMLETDHAEVERVTAELMPRFSGLLSESDRSDVRQLANAISGGADYFVTKDAALRDRADGIFDTHGLTLLSPTELINRLDVLNREQDYQPARLAGSNFKIMLLRSEHEETAVAAFQQGPVGETRGAFLQQLRRYLAQPQSFDCRIAFDGVIPLALSVTERRLGGELNVVMLRVARGRHGRTLARHFLDSAVREAASQGCARICLDDSCLPSIVRTAAFGSGFAQMNNRLTKVALPGILTLADACAKITEYPALSVLAEKCLSTPTLDSAGELERILWPLKLSDTELPSFVVPIRPRWAAHLFDDETAAGFLFGANPDIRFNAEQVYYRSSQAPGGLRAPGRILWYVSKGDEQSFPGPQAITACSLLDEVLVGKPKDLFRSFRRLGVYEWKDVLALAGGSIDTEIMALRFSRTEKFQRKVPLVELKALNVPDPFSPRLIEPEQFNRIYTLGTALNS